MSKSSDLAVRILAVEAKVDKRDSSDAVHESLKEAKLQWLDSNYMLCEKLAQEIEIETLFDGVDVTTQKKILALS